MENKMQEIMSKIELSEEVQKIVLRNVLEETEYQKYKELFYRDSKEFFEKWDEKENYPENTSLQRKAKRYVL